MSVADSLPEQTIHALYVDHHSWLRDWLRKRLGCHADAADLAHDTFLRVLNSRRTAFGAEPRALLTHVAKGLLVDHWRRREVARAYLDAIAHLPEAEMPSPEAQWLVIESLQRIEAMLAALPARTREIFILSQFEELTLAQIAERTATPVITVRRHLRRALIACMAAA